jgi:hypothetical protein
LDAVSFFPWHRTGMTPSRCSYEAGAFSTFSSPALQSDRVERSGCISRVFLIPIVLFFWRMEYNVDGQSGMSRNYILFGIRCLYVYRTYGVTGNRVKVPSGPATVTREFSLIGIHSYIYGEGQRAHRSGSQETYLAATPRNLRGKGAVNTRQYG